MSSLLQRTSPAARSAIFLVLLWMAACTKSSRDEPQPEEPQPQPGFVTIGPLRRLAEIQFQSTAPKAQTYAWDFGDGTTSALANPAHAYNAAGTYAVTLVAAGPGGKAQVSKTLLIENFATADFKHTGALQNFTPIQFTSIAPAAVTYAWNFGDGNTSAEPNPAHTFRRAGTYAVRLRTTGAGGAAEVTKSLTLAQTDTVLAKLAGQYYFGRVTNLVNSSGPLVLLPPVTMTVSMSGLSNPRPTASILANFNTGPCYPVSASWPTSSNYPCYSFSGYYSPRIGPISVYYFYFQQGGDSLIFTDFTIGRHSTKYYGKKIR